MLLHVMFIYKFNGENSAEIHRLLWLHIYGSWCSIVSELCCWQLNNCEGYGVELIMSCVTATPPAYHPHPHRLVGQDCLSGVSRIVIERVQHPQTVVQWVPSCHVESSVLCILLGTNYFIIHYTHMSKHFQNTKLSAGKWTIFSLMCGFLFCCKLKEGSQVTQQSMH